MLFSFSDGLWRVMTLLAMGLVPGASPVEMRLSTTADGAWLRLVLGVLAGLGLVGAIGWMARRSAIASALGWATLLSAMVLSVALIDQQGPLLLGAWAMAPLVWATLGASAAALLARAVPSLSAGERALTLALAAAGLVVAGASLASAKGRLTGREAMWKAALEGNAGHQSAARGYARFLKEAGRTAEARRVIEACVAAQPSLCGCVDEAALEALDRLDTAYARRALEGAKGSCDSPRLRGMLAEALVGEGQIDEGLSLAASVEHDDRESPFAPFARASALYRRGDAPGAEAEARKALELGRGSVAHLLLGLIKLGAGDLDGAGRQFHAVLARHPNDLAATYDLALVAHRAGRYREAREGYLKVLSLDPTHFDARYNLVVLTRDAGALVEARHHFEKLLQQHPRDPRLAPLQRQLAVPGPTP